MVRGRSGNLTRINTELRNFLAKNLGVSTRTIYFKLKKVKDELGFGFSDNVALMVLAGEQGIDVSQYMDDPEERREYREALNLRPRTIERIIQSTPAEVVKIMKVPNMPNVECPNIPDNVFSEAENMTEVYYYLYLFENSIRYFIIDTLSKYGKDWWEKTVGKAVKKNAQKNIAQEERNRWHGKRGKHPIFYTFISDLSSIINVNWTDFKEIFPSQEWLNQRIIEIELSRNTVAHNNSLNNRDFERVKMYFHDWIKQISG